MIHKIPGIDINECNAEQKIAYNYAFSWGDGKSDAQTIFPLIQRDLARRHKDDMSKYDVDLIYSYILRNLQRYMDKPFIAFNYRQIGEFFI